MKKIPNAAMYEIIAHSFYSFKEVMRWNRMMKTADAQRQRQKFIAYKCRRGKRR